MAQRTGLEPATPGVTGRYSNRLNYRSAASPALADLGRTSPKRRLVDSILQGFTGFEARDLGSGDLDRLASLRVATGASSALFDSDGAETNQHDGVTSLQGASDGLDHCVQCATGNSFRDISRCGNCIDQFRLVHSKSPYFC